MLNFGNKDFRNLQEQVLKNMKDIQDIEQGATVLADFGIKIVGQVNDADDLPDPTTYDGEYGDGYVVGDSEPYEYYIFTRAFEGQDEPSWFNLGQFPVPGPQGEAGATGAQGPSGTIAFGSITTSTLNPGQNASVTATNVGSASNAVYNLSFSIPQGAQGIQGATGPQGPQGATGPQGPKGDKGEQGGLIEIVGIVATASDLPSPATLQKLDAAYLVGTSPNYELYVQVGETPSTALWTNLGAINEGTVVTVNGTPQTVWEADSKLSVFDGQLVNTLYGQAAGTGNGQTHVPYGTSATASYIAQRDLNGQLLVPETPTANNMAASKKYVDDNAGGQSPIQYAGDLIVGGGSPVTEQRLAIGSSGQVLKVNSTADGLEWSTINEVPSYTTSDADKVLKTNASGTGLEWGTSSGGGGSIDCIGSLSTKNSGLSTYIKNKSNDTLPNLANKTFGGNLVLHLDDTTVTNTGNINSSFILGPNVPKGGGSNSILSVKGSLSDLTGNSAGQSIILVAGTSTIKTTARLAIVCASGSSLTKSGSGQWSGIISGLNLTVVTPNIIDYNNQNAGVPTYVFGTGNKLDVSSNYSGNDYAVRGATKFLIGNYGFIDSNNYTDMFAVGVGADVNNRANCFATGYDGTNDYIKIGDTKITEAQLQSLLATI